MKKAVLIMAMVSLVCSSQVWAAKGAPNVSNTAHNLALGGFWAGNPFETDAEEVCVFCHTPHGGRLDTASWNSPLWNRADADPALNPDGPPGSWTFYNSATITNEVKAVAAVNSHSMMCLSCHDGSIATNRVLNPPNGLSGINAPQPTSQFGDAPIIGFIPGSFTRIGGLLDVTKLNTDNQAGQLQDDHPISFDYQTLLDNNPGEELNTVAYATNRSIRFFNGPAGNTYVECSSCHDPHVDYNTQPEYDPFLITSNNGSYLCLSCHNK